MTLGIKELDQIAFHEAGPPNPRDETTYFLIHGIGTSLDFWVAVAPLLSRHSRTIAIDIPGFGRSPAPKGKPFLDVAAQRMSQLCETLEVSNGVLVGHSLGSFLALRLAALEPARFNRLILVDGTLKRALELIKHPAGAISQPVLGACVTMQLIGGLIPLKKTAAQIVGRSALLRHVALRPWVDDPGVLDPRLVAEALINRVSLDVPRSTAAARHVDYEKLLRGIAQPVDLVWGEKDNLINSWDIEYVASRLNVDRRLAIPRCGHWPMLEHPQLLAKFINPELEYPG